MDVAYPNGEGNNGGEEGNNDNPDKKDALITFSASAVSYTHLIHPATK